MLKSLENGRLKHWEKMEAPKEAIEYYNLPEGAMMKELILAIRADEACHREVNHHFADLPAWAEVEHIVVQLTEENKLHFVKIGDG